jgi:hypothetical protein
MAKRISVVVSQGQSQHPAKRSLEEDIVTALLMEPGIEVTVIPNLYDLTPDGTGVLALQGISGDMIVLSWLYERAARWILDRNRVHGQLGESLIKRADEDEEDDDQEGGESTAEADDDKQRVIDRRTIPNRKIYCMDLRIHDAAQPYIDEVKRIAAESRTQVVDLTSWIGGAPKPDQMQRFINPANNTALGGNGSHTKTSSDDSSAKESTEPAEVRQPLRIEEQPGRRWYPVIDYSRCTNCMECIDFCLFGVYGVDKVETILVEQPDNCRKGCPACSRVCPENAIIFPQHKTPAIAGAAVDAGMSLKIDLSKLFGAPEGTQDALEVAARERDEQLVLAGRQAVGLSIGIPKRQADKQQAPKDDLDNLLDALDELDL